MDTSVVVFRKRAIRDTGVVFADPDAVPPATSWAGPAAGLTHRWPMDNASVVGTTIVDVVAGLNGSAVGGVGPRSGPFTTSRIFDGTTGYITLPSAPIPDFTASWSVGYWSYLNSIYDNCINDPAFGQRYFNFSDNLSVPFNAANPSSGGVNKPGYINLGKDAATGVSSSAQQVFSATWVHIVFTFDGATYLIYVNGASIATAGVLTTNANASQSAFGGWGDGSKLLAGGLSQFVTYNVALSAADVTNLYNAQ